MKKLALRKEIARSFSKSKSRFISIICLMALGSFALVGLKVTGPDMRTSGEHYFNEHNTADLSVIASYGLDQSDQDIINQANADVIAYGYLKDVTIANEDTAIRVISNTKDVSTYELTKGRFPKTDQEIALQNNMQETYHIGDTIRFHEKKDISGKTVLKQHHFKVVGFINSTEIISQVNEGESTAGTGELRHYATVIPTVFDSDVYMMARLSYADAKQLDPYSDAYAKCVLKHKNELEDLLKTQPQARFTSVKANVQKQLDEGKNYLETSQRTFEDTKQQLDDASQQLQAGKQELANQQAVYNQAILDGQQQLDQAKEVLTNSEATLQQGNIAYQNNLRAYQSKLNTFNTNKPMIEAQIANLEAQQQQLLAIINNPEASDEQKNQASATLIQVQAGIVQYQNGLREAEAQLQAAKAKLDVAASEIQLGERQLQQGKQTYDDTQATFLAQKESGATKLAEASQLLQSKTMEFEAKQAEFASKRPQIEKELADGKSKLSQMEESFDELEQPTYAIQSRKETPGSQGYKIYGSIASIVDSLANVFPIFLYFVAALVTFTTMTRFVDEERINLGTLKALGYENKDIRKKFTLYGLLAALIGTTIGIILGHVLLPMIVYQAYKIGFTVPKIELHMYPGVSIVAIILSLISAVLPAYMVASRELKSRPSILLQPKAPKAGSKILLERIKPLWSSLSFTQKVTARNLFRYKKRAFMTIFGVCGAVTLLFAGFSVQHSISGIGERQFGSIIKYDMIVAKDSTIQSKQQERLDKQLETSPIKRNMPINFKEMSISPNASGDKQDVKIIIPSDANKLNDYIHLDTRKGKTTINLKDGGVIVSERLAKSLDATIGDTITIQDANNKNYQMKINGICEMYMGHFVFMNQSTYQQVFKETYTNNAYFVQLHNRSIENANNQAAKFVDLPGIKGVVQNTTLINQIDTIVHALDMIMEVLITVAALLAVVILYNLTNINISERIRELSTIKVLGFYDKEVTMYIYRETIILTIIGILTGFAFGGFLHLYILHVVPPEDVMFDPTTGPNGYLVSIILVSIVTFILGVFVNRKLRKEDMLQALKSVD